MFNRKKKKIEVLEAANTLLILKNRDLKQLMEKIKLDYEAKILELKIEHTKKATKIKKK